jgi:aryl-phospho-beta-D-glucosidase BglC (GH1 family)
MKAIILFLVLSFSFYNFLLSQEKNFVSSNGKHITLTGGEPVLLKGINLGNWLVPEGYMFKFKNATSPRKVNEVICELIGPDRAKKFWIDFQDAYITREDIFYIKQLGFNHIRLPFNYRLFADETYLQNTSQRGFELFDRLLEWCGEVNLYVLLDMHCAPGGQTGDNIDDSFGYPWLFENSESQQLTVDVWESIAEKYSDEKMLIGYDLLNEPIAHYFELEKLKPRLEPLYKRIVQAIRKHDSNHLIFLGGARWNTDFSVFGKPFDDKLVYTFHKYWMPPEQKEIQEYVDFSNKYDVPLYLGESGENDDEWINNFRALLESNNIGWGFWPYKKMESSRGVVEFDMPDNYELVIDFANGDHESYKSIRENRPDYETVRKALDEFIENSKFRNCRLNQGYIKALGLNN